MRLLHIGQCIFVAMAASILFVAAAALTASAPAETDPLWKRSCSLTGRDVQCGDYAAKLTAAEALAAISPNSVVVTCEALATHGLAGELILTCSKKEPTP